MKKKVSFLKWLADVFFVLFFFILPIVSDDNGIKQKNKNVVR